MERLNKEHKEVIMDMINKAGSENYQTLWTNKDNGKLSISKDKIEVKKGRKSRAQGARFELKVREDLESKGMVVDKWSNNIDLEKKEIIIAKRKYNPFKKMMMAIGTGFPDFIAIKHVHDGLYRIIGVEVKTNGTLSKEEKEKCALYLQKEVFSKIWIAKAVKKGNKTEIEYDDFLEKYGKNYNKT